MYFWCNKSNPLQTFPRMYFPKIYSEHLSVTLHAKKQYLHPHPRYADNYSICHNLDSGQNFQNQTS